MNSSISSLPFPMHQQTVVVSDDSSGENLFKLLFMVSKLCMSIIFDITVRSTSCRSDMQMALAGLDAHKFLLSST
jgi:hypothetical protein